jgi:hypothetical protein
MTKISLYCPFKAVQTILITKNPPPPQENKKYPTYLYHIMPIIFYMSTVVFHHNLQLQVFFILPVVRLVAGAY